MNQIIASQFVISYNNEGFIKYEDMIDVLSDYGEVKVLTEKYPTFRGCRNLTQRELHTTEFLFLVEGDKKNEI